MGGSAGPDAAADAWSVGKGGSKEASCETHLRTGETTWERSALSLCLTLRSCGRFPFACLSVFWEWDFQASGFSELILSR